MDKPTRSRSDSHYETRKDYKDQDSRIPDHKSWKPIHESRKTDYDPRKMARSFEDPPQIQESLFTPVNDVEVTEEPPDDGLHFIHYLPKDE